MVLRNLALVLVLCVLPLSGVGAQLVEFEKTRVWVETGAGARYPFHVDLAVTPAQRRQGLMFRDALPDDGGMLFLFEEPELATFWMRNTFISLDILFLAQDGQITNIHHRAVPGSTEVLASAGPVTGVLEIVGGTAQRLGIRAGDRVDHDHFR